MYPAQPWTTTVPTMHLWESFAVVCSLKSLPLEPGPELISWLPFCNNELASKPNAAQEHKVRNQPAS